MEDVKRWFGQAVDFLDSYGFGAWIAAMVAGFILFAPLGLAVLGYMIWSGRMGRGWKRGRCGESRRASTGTGNAAFDAYREETLRRLEDERQAFTEFLERLRRAKDQAEFDQFMNEQRAGGAPRQDSPRDVSPAAPSGGFGGGPAPQPAG